jgi:preprotein translocase subunit SecY
VINAVRSIVRIPDLRTRILFTLGMLAVYRLGNHVPTPGVNPAALTAFFEQNRATWFGFVDMFSGGNLSQVTVFALGIMPYISASIILQLLTVVWPYLERLSKEGELGRRKITQYTRYGTLLLCVVQAFAIAFWLESQTNIAGGLPLVYEPGWGFRLLVVLTLTTGTCFIMWLGEQVTERGIGNGMSLIIFAGIVVNLPAAVLNTLDQLRTGQMGLFRLLMLSILMILVIGAVVFIERGQRRVTVQYAKRVVGRRMYGGTSTHIPLKVNTGGVIPVIFASSILAVPATAVAAFPVGGWGQTLTDQLQNGRPWYYLLFVGLIIFFAYFYTAIIFNPDDVAENMRKYGGFVPGIRPGKRTAEYIDTILTRITLAGSIYLALVAVLPDLMIVGFRADAMRCVPFLPDPCAVVGDWLDANVLPNFISNGLGVTFYFGGTSLLIIVGVSMDTVQQVESQLIMRHYDGFMKKTRIKGRRA